MNNPPKLYGIIVGMICITVLIAIHAVEQAVGTPILSGLVLYLIGNGVAGKNGQPSGPALGKTGTAHVLVDSTTGEPLAVDGPPGSPTPGPAPGP